jgi:hypothetical protein
MIKNGWTHPAQLTNGGVFASTSPEKRARRAAYGLMAVIFQLYRGGKGAELFRWQWRHTSVVLASGAKNSCLGSGPERHLAAVSEGLFGYWLLDAGGWQLD